MEREKAQKALIKACAQILKCADNILEGEEIKKANGIELQIIVDAGGATMSKVSYLTSFSVLPD